jgi:hypothetical protein
VEVVKRKIRFPAINRTKIVQSIDTNLTDYISSRPTDGASTLLWWWDLSAPESYAGGSVATGRATHARQVKG